MRNDSKKSQVPEVLLLPFKHGWKREVHFRADKSGTCDIYYTPPIEIKRKKLRSMADQEKYFEEFPSKVLSPKNFSYSRVVLGLVKKGFEVVTGMSAVPTSKARTERKVNRTESPVVSGKLVKVDVKMMNQHDLDKERHDVTESKKRGRPKKSVLAEESLDVTGEKILEMVPDDEPPSHVVKVNSEIKDSLGFAYGSSVYFCKPQWFLNCIEPFSFYFSGI